MLIKKKVEFIYLTCWLLRNQRLKFTYKIDLAHLYLFKIQISKQLVIRIDKKNVFYFKINLILQIKKNFS